MVFEKIVQNWAAFVDYFKKKPNMTQLVQKYRDVEEDLTAAMFEDLDEM